MKTLSRWLLAIGFMPVIVNDFLAQGDVLKRDMKLLGLSTSNVARELNVSEATIQSVVNSVSTFRLMQQRSLRKSTIIFWRNKIRKILDKKKVQGAVV